MGSDFSDGHSTSRMPGRADAIGRSAQDILENLAQSAVGQTPFRRALVTLFAQPISPSPLARTRVAACASSGLCAEDKRQVEELLERGWEIGGGRFSGEFQMGASYLIPQDSAPEVLGPRVESKRRYLHPASWRRHDILVTPLRAEGRYIGSLSVDDPRDGARPDRRGLAVLEHLTRLAEAALSSEPCRGPARDGLSMGDRDDLFAVLAEHCMAGLLVTRGERVEYANQRVVDLFGYSKEELYSMRPWWQLIHPEDRGQLKEGQTRTNGTRARAARKDGSSAWVLVRSYALEVAGQRAHLVDLWDISEQVEIEGALKQKALRDPLTGLYNRHYFEESIRAELKRAQRYGRSFTLVVADLKGFKRVNDHLGHAKGDEVLQAIAGVLKATVRESDWLVRYGGDEFLLVLPETSAPVDVVLHRLEQAVVEWSREHLPDIEISVDTGWATWSPGCGRSIRDLLNAADAQMYAAKRAESPRGEG